MPDRRREDGSMLILRLDAALPTLSTSDHSKSGRVFVSWLPDPPSGASGAGNIFAGDPGSSVVASGVGVALLSEHVSSIMALIRRLGDSSRSRSWGAGVLTTDVWAGSFALDVLAVSTFRLSEAYLLTGLVDFPGFTVLLGALPDILLWGCRWS